MENEDQLTGEYVYGSAYRLMRLRMLLTGTASPTEEQWSEALGNLLEELPLLREEAAEAGALRNEIARLKSRNEELGWEIEASRDADMERRFQDR